MDRRTFGRLAGLAAVRAMAQKTELHAESNGSAAGRRRALSEEVVLEDKELLVAFDKASGALTRLERKSTHWVIERRPELGISFRLLAPLPHQRANFIFGQKQRAIKVEKLSDSRVEMVWENPISEHGGVVPMTLTATASLEEGVLTLEAILANHSRLTIETVDYPYFGDLNPPAPARL